MDSRRLLVTSNDSGAERATVDRRISHTPFVNYNTIRDLSVHGTALEPSRGGPLERERGTQNPRQRGPHGSAAPQPNILHSTPIRYTGVRRATGSSLLGSSSTGSSTTIGEEEQLYGRKPVSLITMDMRRPSPSTSSSTLSKKESSNTYHMDATESVASTQATGRFVAWKSEVSCNRPTGPNSSERLDADEDKLFNAACNCGARDQLLKCRARLDSSSRDMERKIRMAMGRRDRAAEGLEHVMNLSRELDVVRREARSKQSGWDLALEDARRTAGELRERDSWLITREGALTQRREKTSTLRQRVRSKERQVDELVGESRKEYRRLKQELADAKITGREITSTLEGIRENLSKVRERLVAEEEALEAATHDGEILKGMLEEVPSILSEVDSNREAVTEEIRACRQRVDAITKEEDIYQYKRLESRRCKVAARMEGLQAEKREISLLALSLDELQCKVCTSEGARSRRSSCQIDVSTDPRESDLLALEREVTSNDEKLRTYVEGNAEARKRRDRLEFKLEVSKRQFDEARARARKAVPYRGRGEVR